MKMEIFQRNFKKFIFVCNLRSLGSRVVQTKLRNVRKEVKVNDEESIDVLGEP